MEIIMGKYRDCVPSKEVLIELAHQIPASEADRLCKLLDVKMEQPDPELYNVVLELLVRWMEQGKGNSRNLLKKLAGESEEDFRKRMDRNLSDKVYDAGYINLANEIMTGIRHGKVTQVTNSSSPMVQDTGCQVSDDIVVVDARPILLRGLPGKLKCQFSVVPQAVYWLKAYAIPPILGAIFAAVFGVTCWFFNKRDYRDCVGGKNEVLTEVARQTSAREAERLCEMVDSSSDNPGTWV
ncbi:uncharacterized protein [Diadema setosum]|uniref:uncharacterized protein n=1 Tax=Diadema setosum TaxID=31175 RepID=UPI003B3A3C80